MAPSRRGRGHMPLTVQPPTAAAISTVSSALPDLPPISALFLIEFDVKAGYTIVWKRAIPGIELESVVEYKSLPSGLHTVKDDLIYFVHEAGHAGLSAFLNTPCDEEGARHARMIAVGILVPLSFGRLGRAWRHAEGLKRMASTLAADRKQTAILEEYWEANQLELKGEANATEHELDHGYERPIESPVASPAVTFRTLHGRTGHARNRSASDGTTLLPPSHKLSPFHPAWSLTALLDTFGPLIFPIQRAALLRRRILISCQPPVQEVCNFVYNISVLSNIPASAHHVLPPDAPTQRLRPLFAIGVHDIPFLLEDHNASRRQVGDDSSNAAAEEAGGWIACTTDSILAMKDTLWDVLITMPPPHSPNATEKVWPTVEGPRGQVIKATQRDRRRFLALRAGLARLTAAASPSSPRDESVHSRLSANLRPSTGTSSTVSSADESLDRVVEPLGWAALAYSGFMWWASAGEQGRTDEHEEAAHDASLLADWAPAPSTVGPVSSSNGDMLDSISSLGGRRMGGVAADDEAKVELAIVAYFHRLTGHMLSVSADVVDRYTDSYDDDDESSYPDVTDADDVPLRRGGGNFEGQTVHVDSDAVENMGLDIWSSTDAKFVGELMERYFARRAHIEGKGVDICGVRIC